jgi:TIR domain-containing protein
MTTKRVFISHAAKDKSLVDPFVDLLVTGVGLTNNQVFCTSVEGLGIPAGKNFIQVIKSEIQNPELVIVLLSPNYYESVFCLCELGASWALSHEAHPLLVPPLEFRDVKDVLTGVQLEKVDDPVGLSNLRDHICALFDIKDVPTARWDAKKNGFLEKLNGILPTLAEPTTIRLEKHKELQKKYDDSVGELQKAYSEIASLNNTIGELKACKDASEVREVLARSTKEWDRFDSLTQSAAKFLNELPRVVHEAAYYHINEKDYCPQGEDWQDIDRACEERYLEVDRQDETVDLNLQDPKVRRAVERLREVETFLKREATEEFWLLYKSQYDHLPEIDSKKLWKMHLSKRIR